MADLTFSSTPILRDLYDNPTDALNRSKEMGCDGYRTYIINGITKYVPCSTYIQYEKALRYITEQGKLAVFGNEVFGDKLVGFQYANAKSEVEKGDPFFTLGNFSISKSITAANPNNILIAQPDQTKKYTAQSIAESANISGEGLLDKVSAKVQSGLKVNVLFDRKKLENFVMYSSLKERFKNTIIEITQSYPGGIKITPISILYPSVSNYVKLVSDNRAQFKVGLYNVFNPFGIDFISSGTTKSDDVNLSPLRNFAKTFRDYVVLYNGVEYPIIDASLPLNPNDTTTGIQLTTDGTPFLDKINGNNEANALFYIKPKTDKYNEFIDNLSDLGKFLLNYNVDDGTYKSEFVTPEYTDDGDYTLITQTIYFPQMDEVNINLFDTKFDDYLTQLNDISDGFDKYKTNLINRFLTTDSLKEFDTPDRKVNVIFQLYGRIFDEVKKYIDGIAFMTNLSYDKVENIPDLLVKNFAHLLGFETFEIEDENSLVESLFNLKDQTVSNSMTPAELDIELWRRIAINAFYLFKNKGTRKSLEFILRLVGVPEYLIEVNEYIYLANHPVDVIEKLNKIYQSLNNVVDPLALVGQYPFDSDGFPTVPPNIAFQSNGGFYTENAQNLGPYDFGKAYINAYKKFETVSGFDMIRTLDNQKSWVYDTSPNYRTNDSDLRSTHYLENDSRLVINSKELEVYLSSDRAVDHTIYKYFVTNNINIDTSLDPVYTQVINPSQITFNQFVKDVVANYIGVESRKTIKSYPTLTKIYFDFQRKSGSYVTDGKILEFLSHFDTYWVKLIEQFTPATSIVNTGKKIRNNSFLDNKFVYQHGVNQDINWLGTSGSEFQYKALKPVYQGKTLTTSNTGKVHDSINGNPITFQISGKRGGRGQGTDMSVNEYAAFYYSTTDFCDSDGRFYNWEKNTDYTATGYSGNINETVSSPTGYLTSVLYNNDWNKLRRYGVFVVYQGNLYRLNTMLNLTKYPAYPTPYAGSTVAMSQKKIITVPTVSGTTYNQDPISGDLIYKDTTNGHVILTFSGTSLYTFIPRGMNAKTIVFPDCDGIKNPLPNRVEREFFFNSISMAYAYIDIDVDFDCPPPNPHICYYDFSGRTINMNFNSSVATTYPAIANYTDQNNVARIVRQPRYYGFSKNIATAMPVDSLMGRANKWAVPYKKRKQWINGVVYYTNDIVYRTTLPTTSYVITGLTVTGTSFAPIVSPTSGIGLSTNVLGGMFENYSGRTTTDPLMHIDPAFISTFNVDPLANIMSINLTKSLNLQYIFSGKTSATTFVVTDNIVNNQLFFTDSFTLNFDGIYPIDSEKVGPFYTPLPDDAMVQTLMESLSLVPNQANYVSIQSLNTNFPIDSLNASLRNSNPGFYLIKNNAYLKFNVQLYFESELTTPQIVKVRLVDINGTHYNEQEFTFSGNDAPDDRVYSYEHEGFFFANQRVYIVVEPIDNPCSLSRYEQIDYNHNDVPINNYNPLEDGRFRLMFNGGRRINYGEDYEYALSIAPILSKVDPITGITTTTSTFFKVDNYIYNNNNNNNNRYFLNVPKFSLNQSTDSSLIFNKLFGSYYKKFQTDNIATETQKALYDKDIFYDKIDFNFNVVTKKLPLNAIFSSGSTEGIFAISQLIDFSANEYYLGNTSEVYEGGGITNNIIIGKNITKRIPEVNTGYFYQPSKSQLNASIVLDTGNTLMPKLFQAYSTGILDYTNLDFNNTNNIYQNRRFVLTGKTYQIENEVYESEIYKSILENAESFNQYIINYQLNDVVKFTINNYKKLTPNANGGFSIETVNVDRLFVCVEDITINHCLKLTSGSTIIPLKINDVYTPNGIHSCFEEIVKYDPKRFSPWGYERFGNNHINHNNIIPYTNGIIKQYNETGTTLNLSYGDIVQNRNNIYKFIYNKPLMWYTGTTLNNINNQKYNKWDFVIRKNNFGNYRFYRNTFSTFTSTDPLLGGSWELITTGNTFNDYLNPFNTGDDTTTITAYRGYTTVVKLPNIIPADKNGNIIGWTLTGSTTTPKNGRIGLSCMYEDVMEYSTSGRNVFGYYTFVKRVTPSLGTSYITGIAAGSVVFGTNPTYQPNLGLTTDSNIYYYKCNQNMTIEMYGSGNNGVPNKFLDAMNQNISPLFSWLCYSDQINNPQDYSATAFYDKYNLYHSKKYAVNRGVLYRYIKNIPGTTSTPPFADGNNWVLNDFCLVQNYTFFKDRTKVSVFESSVESLTDDVKNTFYFYKNNLALKQGFTSRDFSGTSIDNKLLIGMDKFTDAKDSTLNNVIKYGTFSYRKQNNDIILDYTIEKDPVGLPRTGEFIGKLNIVDPCGQSASTVFGLLFDTDISKLSLLAPGVVNVPSQTNQPFILPNNIRLIVNQNGSTAIRVNWSTSDKFLEGTKTVDANSIYDDSLVVQPNSTLTLTFDYDTRLNYTTYEYAYMDNVLLYDNLGNGVQNASVESTVSKNGTVETRTIKLINISQNRLIRFGVKGLSGIATNQYAIKNVINVNASSNVSAG